MCVNDKQVCEQVFKIQVIGIWRVSCAQAIYVFESVTWKETLQISDESSHRVTNQNINAICNNFKMFTELQFIKGNH